MPITEFILWLFLLNLGVAFGAGVYEARVVLPQWTRPAAGPGFHWNAELARRTDPGLTFWAFVTTGPLTILTLASLLMAWRTPGPRGAWWFTAAVIVLLERVATFGYFIPTMVRLQGDAPPPEPVVRARVSRWLALNYVRNAAYLAAWVAAMLALRAPGR
jgi:anthrone oxygenase-like protein